MKVILLEDVAKIGKAGTVKEVKRGYGFNYLLPAGLASLATASALSASLKRLEKKQKQGLHSAEGSARKRDTLNGKTLSLKRQAMNDKLFGSVTKEELSRELTAQGFAVEASEIILEKPIKKTGVFSLNADFGNDCRAEFKIDIQAESK